MSVRTAARSALIRPALRRLRRPPAGASYDAVVAPLNPTLNSVTLVAAKMAAMGIGFLFWLLAARAATPEEVGLAAGAVSAMILCTQVAILGFGSAVITHTRTNRDRLPVLLNSALTLVVGLSVVASLVFVVISGLVLDQLDVVAHSPWFATLFVTAAVFGTLGILLDQSGAALRRGDQALVRNLAFGVATLLSLGAVALWLHPVPAVAIFAAWAVAGAVGTAAGLRHLRRSVRGYRPRARVDGPLSRRLLRSALPNYVLSLTDRAPGLLLPILVTELLSPATNATWYAVWMMAWVVYTVPTQVGLTTFSEISRDPGRQADAIRHGLRSSLLMGGILAALVALCAEPLLQLLGRHYAEGGVTPLRILVLAWIPLAFVQCYFASARARRRLGEAIVVGTVSAVLSVSVAAVAGVNGDLTAMALAWLAAQTATGVWAVIRLRPASVARVDPSEPVASGDRAAAG